MKKEDYRKILVLVKNYGLKEESIAEIYASIKRLVAFEYSKGEKIDFKLALILWDEWVGYPLYSKLDSDWLIKALFSDRRLSLFHEAMRRIEENHFIFSDDMVTEIAIRRHLKEMASIEKRRRA